MTAVHDASDQELLYRTVQGEDEAFDELYERYLNTIYRFAFRMLGSPDRAEDVAHDCFLGLIQNPKRFDPRKGSLRTYLYIAVRNLVCKRLRKKSFEFPIEDIDAAIPAGSEPLPQLLAWELSSQVRRSIRNLPQQQREVILFFEYEHLTLAEIATITASDLSAVKSRLHRARQLLRVEMAAYMNGGSQKYKARPNHE